MKKVLAFVLVLLFALSVAGCQNKTVEKPDVTEPSENDGIQNAILDGGADIAIDAETDDALADQDANYEILNGVLDGGADIGVDAEP